MHEEASLGLELHTGRSIGIFHQAWVLFWKRFTILHRNYVPHTAALLPPVIAARGVTLLLKDFSASVCVTAQQISLSDVETLFAQPRYNLLVGPSSSVSNATLTSLYEPILLTTTPQSLIQRYLYSVDSLSDFNNDRSREFANFTPAGFFLDGPRTTLAYKGNGDVCNAIFGHNTMDAMRTYISISTQFSSFDIPWAPSTEKSLKLVVYFCLAMAAYPGFFSLYLTVERTRNIRDLEYSNGL
jgi:hypothetical protein